MRASSWKCPGFIKNRHGCALGLVLLLLALHAAMGTSPLAPGAYNSYTLQALAWRGGKTYLPADVPHLELAIKDGLYYVSFPPVPSIPLYFLSFLFGEAIPDGLLVMLYILIAYYALAHALEQGGWREMQASICAFLLCTASSMLPLLLSGAVWYQAQVMAYMLTSLAIGGMFKKRRTSSLLYYALSVRCRPFNALYGFVLLFIYASNRDRSPGSSPVKDFLKPLLPGIMLGLGVAAVYGWYNFIRFGNPFEFGHNYLPEFSFQGGRQFSLSHIPGNAATFIFGLPFERNRTGDLVLRQFGFSLFLANPILLVLVLAFIADAFSRRLNAFKALIFFLFVMHLLLLLSHRTFGGFQFGARYAVDLIPYAIVYLSVGGFPQAWKKPCLILLMAGLVFNIYGSLRIMLPG